MYETSMNENKPETMNQAAIADGGFTVAKLIEKLKEFDQNAIVVLPLRASGSRDCDICTLVAAVKIDDPQYGTYFRRSFMSSDFDHVRWNVPAVALK